MESDGTADIKYKYQDLSLVFRPTVQSLQYRIIDFYHSMSTESCVSLILKDHIGSRCWTDPSTLKGPTSHYGLCMPMPLNYIGTGSSWCPFCWCSLDGIFIIFRLLIGSFNLPLISSVSGCGHLSMFPTYTWFAKPLRISYSTFHIIVSGTC